MHTSSRAPLARIAIALAGTIAALNAAPALADPVTISNAGYWLETLGENTIGLPGSATGAVTTLFVANTDPSAAQGTTASASLGGVATTPPVLADPLLWARRIVDPSTFQRQALTVEFLNGTDTASFTGFDLRGLDALPLAANLAVDGSGDPLGPVISWTLPSGPNVDIDRVQLVFYSDATNAEIGSRVTLSGSATSFDLAGPLPAGLALTVNVRFIDLADDAAAFEPGNVLRASRSYINYATPVPEPASLLLTLVGLAGLAGWVAWRKTKVEAVPLPRP